MNQQEWKVVLIRSFIGPSQFLDMGIIYKTYCFTSDLCIFLYRIFVVKLWYFLLTLSKNFVRVLHIVIYSHAVVWLNKYLESSDFDDDLRFNFLHKRNACVNLYKLYMQNNHMDKHFKKSVSLNTLQNC